MTQPPTRESGAIVKTIFIFVTDRNHIVQVALTYQWGPKTWDVLDAEAWMVTGSWKATPAGVLGCDKGDWVLIEHTSQLSLKGFPRDPRAPQTAHWFLNLWTTWKSITDIKVGDHGRGQYYGQYSLHPDEEVTLKGIAAEKAAKRANENRLNADEIEDYIEWEVKKIC